MSGINVSVPYNVPDEDKLASQKEIVLRKVTTNPIKSSQEPESVLNFENSIQIENFIKNAKEQIQLLENELREITESKNVTYSTPILLKAKYSDNEKLYINYKINKYFNAKSSNNYTTEQINKCLHKVNSNNEIFPKHHPSLESINSHYSSKIQPRQSATKIEKLKENRSKIHPSSKNSNINLLFKHSVSCECKKCYSKRNRSNQKSSNEIQKIDTGTSPITEQKNSKYPHLSKQDLPSLIIKNELSIQNIPTISVLPDPNHRKKYNSSNIAVINAKHESENSEKEIESEIQGTSKYVEIDIFKNSNTTHVESSESVTRVPQVSNDLNLTYVKLPRKKKVANSKLNKRKFKTNTTKQNDSSTVTDLIQLLSELNTKSTEQNDKLEKIIPILENLNSKNNYNEKNDSSENKNGVSEMTNSLNKNENEENYSNDDFTSDTSIISNEKEKPHEPELKESSTVTENLFERPVIENNTSINTNKDTDNTAELLKSPDPGKTNHEYLENPDINSNKTSIVENKNIDKITIIKEDVSVQTEESFTRRNNDNSSKKNSETEKAQTDKLIPESKFRTENASNNSVLSETVSDSQNNIENQLKNDSKETLKKHLTSSVENDKENVKSNDSPKAKISPKKFELLSSMSSGDTTEDTNLEKTPKLPNLHKLKYLKKVRRKTLDYNPVGKICDDLKSSLDAIHTPHKSPQRKTNITDEYEKFADEFILDNLNSVRLEGGNVSPLPRTQEYRGKREIDDKENDFNSLTSISEGELKRACTRSYSLGEIHTYNSDESESLQKSHNLIFDKRMDDFQRNNQQSIITKVTMKNRNWYSLCMTTDASEEFSSKTDDD